MKQSIVIIGTGGHAKVVSEVVAQNSLWTVAAYIDENKKEETFLTRPIFASIEQLEKTFPDVRCAFVAIGNNRDRKKWHENLISRKWKIPSLTHSFASVSPSATIGDGALIAAGAIVGSDARISEGAIVNSASVVDHDSVVGSFAHLSQGVLVCGGATVGAQSTVGPGSVVEKMASLPASSILPARSVVASPFTTYFKS